MEQTQAKPRRRLALAQCAPSLGDLKANIELHLELTQQAAAEQAHLVAFPELSLTGYFLKDLVPDLAMDLDDPRLMPLLEASRQIDVAFGMVVKSEDFRYYNAAVYLSGGQIKHSHLKGYLRTYGWLDEHRYFSTGDRIRTFYPDLACRLLCVEHTSLLCSPTLLFAQDFRPRL